MKILVINTGSSSIKYELFDMHGQHVVASGLAEKIGEATGVLTHRVVAPTHASRQKKEKGMIADHEAGLSRIVEVLIDRNFGAVADKQEIDAVGHRVVHGGEAFKAPTLIDDAVIEAIKANIALAPLHNPANLTGIAVARSIFPQAPQVAVFDTAFHQTLPMRAFLYAIPFDLYTRHKIRRYGFHGTSHAYVAGQAARYLNHEPADINLITIHIGNGVSMAAIQQGVCIDTSMGMTPLAGLMMGTRSGDVDPALPFFLAHNLKMPFDQVQDILNTRSGLKGICGTNDMREILKLRKQGDERAQIALDLYTYRIKKYLGAYWAAMGRLDAVVFTAGIGENAPYIRSSCCQGLAQLGLTIDAKRNVEAGDGMHDISGSDSNVRVLVVPTNETLQIAQETWQVIKAHTEGLP
jgi:acetate kinase